MAQVQFKRGTATNFNSLDPKDAGTLYVVGNVTAYDSGTGPNLEPTPGDYCEMFLGGNLIGVGHLATKKRPGLIPNLPANNQTNYWLQASASGPQWANLSEAIGLDDVLLRHGAQNIYSEKSVLGNDFNIIGAVKDDSGDAAADEASTHLKLFTYPGLKSFISDNDHGSGYWTDSPNILFKGFKYKEDFLDQTCITDYTGTSSSRIGYWSTASYSIGKRLASEVRNANNKLNIANPGGENDYIYLESEISRFAESSPLIKNTIMTVSSPNGADIIKKGGGALYNIITFEGTTVTPISGDIQELQISPIIHIKDYNGASTVTISGDSGLVKAKSFKLDSVSGTDNEKWIRADGSTSAGGRFSQNDPGIVQAYGTGWTSTGDVFLTANGWTEISGLGSLDLTNVMYTNTDQTVSGKKTYSQNQEITSTSTQKALILRNGSETSTTAHGDTPAIIFAQGKSIFDGTSPGNYPDWKVFANSNSVNSTDLKIQTTKTSSTWTDFIRLRAGYGNTSSGITANTNHVYLGTSTANVKTETYGDIKLISPETEGQTPAIDFFRDTDTAEDILNWKMYAANNGALHIAPYLQGGSLGSNERVIVRIDNAAGTIPQLVVGNAYMGEFVRSGSGIDYPGTYSFASDAGGIYIDVGDIVAREGSIYADRGGSVVVKYDVTGGVKSPRFYVTDSSNSNAASSPDTFIRANGGGFGGVFTGAEYSSAHDEWETGAPGLVPQIDGSMITEADSDAEFYVLTGNGSWTPISDITTSGILSNKNNTQNTRYPLLMDTQSAQSQQSNRIGSVGRFDLGSTSRYPALDYSGKIYLTGVTLVDATTGAANTYSNNEYVKADGSGAGGVYTWDSQNDEGVPGLVPGGADDDTLFLQSSGEWANPLENFSAENVTASYLDSTAGSNYYPLLILGDSAPEDSVENAELKYQATYSSGSYSYKLKADKGGNLMAYSLTAANGVTVTAGGVNVTAGGVTVNGGNISATAGDIVTTIVMNGNNQTSGHFYWKNGANYIAVCEWGSFD